MSKSKDGKRHNLWTPKDLARVAEHLRDAGYEESLIYLAVRSQESFTIDDKARSLEPAIGMIKTFRSIRRWIKLIGALLAVIVVLTGGAAAPFILPLEAELLAVLLAISVFAAELKRIRKYVIEVRHIIGSDVDDRDVFHVELPSEEEIDEAAKEADDMASKINQLLDGLDVVFD